MKEKTRGQIIWEKMRDLRETAPVSIDRAVIITRSYKETEGLPMEIRRALAYKKVMEEIPIYIDDMQLLVGDFSSHPMSPTLFPELVVDWVKDYVNQGMYDEQKDGEYGFEMGKRQELDEIIDYWKDKAQKEAFYKYMGEEYVDSMTEANEAGAWIYASATEAQTDKGWNIPDYSRLIKKGLKGLINDLDKSLENLEILDDESYGKMLFLKGLRIMLESSITYAKRYSRLAKEMAEKEADPERKKELETIADVCAKVPENPCETYQEAIQTLLFGRLFIWYDSRANGLGFGRVDQILYPYYKHDTDNGLIDREYATQLAECFRIKIMGLRNLWALTLRQNLTVESHFYNCVLGGQTKDGKDAVNEVSYIWLDAAERVRTPHPTISIRWHENLNRDFALRALEVVKLGMGFPAWFNDKTCIDYLLSKGVSLDDAREYAVGGCVIIDTVGSTGVTWPAILNLGKVFEMAMNDGLDPRTGKQFGPHTGHFEDFDSYEEFTEALYKQIDYWVGYCFEHGKNNLLHRARYFPDMVMSAFFDDCIKKGKSILADGAKYPIDQLYLLPVGVVDVANSLQSVKELVFEKKLITSKELLDALKSNFEGHEDILNMCKSTDKFGNDCEGVDYLVNDIYEHLVELAHSRPKVYGGSLEIAPHSIAFHAGMGVKTGALPNGKLAGASLADGAVSPTQGTDINGPTAVINSAGRIDHTRILGTLFNMKLSPSMMKTEEDREKVLALISTYFGAYGGMHIQFNVIDRETLLKAKANPQEYRNLIVRVAGYSALWTELNPQVHDELIARTENTFG